MKLSIKLFFLLCLSLSVTFSGTAATAATQPDRSAEVNQFISMLHSDVLKTRIDAAKKISRSGLRDQRLFDRIRDQLLQNYQRNSTNSDHIDEMSWLCKALASSGDSNYIPALKQVISGTSSQKLKRYAEQSLGLVEVYAQRNRVMAQDTNSDPALSPEINRYVNMLKSDDLAMKRDAAKTVYRKHYTEEKLFDVIRDELLKGYKGSGKLHTDTMAWLCKALASSGNLKYRTALEEVLRNSGNEKLKRYAKQSLGTLN